MLGQHHDAVIPCSRFSRKFMHVGLCVYVNDEIKRHLRIIMRAGDLGSWHMRVTAEDKTRPQMPESEIQLLIERWMWLFYQIYCTKSSFSCPLDR